MVRRRRHEQLDDMARSAYTEARKLQKSWTSMARVMTRNPRVKVILTSGGQSCTDGETIFIKVPLELANMGPHDGDACSKRDENLLLLCNRCRFTELANIIVIHEISHIVEQTFEKVTLYERAEIIRRAIDSECAGKSETSRAVKLKKQIESAPDNKKDDYLNLLSLVSPYMQLLFNAAEDVRVNRLMQEHRPGTRIMFESMTNEIFLNGVKLNNGEQWKWSEAPPNAQAMIGVYCKVSGFRYQDWLDEKIVQDLDDPGITKVCELMKEAPTARSMYRLVFPLLEAFRKLGYFKTPEEPEDEPPPPPEDEDEQQEDQPEPQQGEEDDSDSGEGESQNQGDTGDGESDEEQDAKSDGEGMVGEPSTEGSNPDEEVEDQSDGGSSGSEDGRTVDPEGSPDHSESSEVDGSAEPSDESDTEDGDGESSSDTPGDESDAEGSDDSGEDGAERSDGSSDEDRDSSKSSEREDGSPDDDGESSSSDGGTDDGGQAEGDPSGSDPSESGEREDDGSPEGESTADGDASGMGAAQDSSDSDSVASPDVPQDHAGQPQGQGPVSDAVESPDGDPTAMEDTPQAPEPFTEEDQQQAGLPDIVQELFNIFGGHADQNDEDSEAEPGTEGSVLGPQSDMDPYEEREYEAAMQRAIEQVDWFDAPSLEIQGLKKSRREDWNEEQSGHPWSTRGRYCEREVPKIPEGILIPALQKLRVAFTDNKRVGMEFDQKSGKLDRRILGRRIATGDSRLFYRKTIPDKKDYFVLVGLDVSGSTSRPLDNDNSRAILDLMKEATFAKAELLNRLGVTFAIYAHSGQSRYVTIYEVKSAEEPWGKKQKESLAALQPTSANLDGHTLEHYRKMCQLRRETDKVILYYTDGAMPLSNYNEELEILQREIKLCGQLGIKIVGVGIENDDPTEHGLDTIRLDQIEDVPMVVEELRRRLTGSATPVLQG